MIDAHVHVVPPRLPGVGPLHPRLESSVEAVAELVRGEMADAGVTQALAIGSWSTSEDDPLGIARTLEIADRVSGLGVIGACDPIRSDPEQRKRVEVALASGRVKALKIYLGYLHFEPSHANYRPYYELAERFALPVLFHAGDTYSPFAKMRFAQPLSIDEVAVDHPKVKFVIAHVGNPWMTDAAAVVYKNVNVWTDLSGLVVGQEWQHPDEETQARLEDVRQCVLKAFRYAERPNRFLFGTDWPLVSMGAYQKLLADWFPEPFHDLIFQENARTLFKL